MTATPPDNPATPPDNPDTPPENSTTPPDNPDTPTNLTHQTTTPTNTDPHPTDVTPHPPELLHHLTHNIRWITLNRPSSLNALAPRNRDALIALLHDSSADPAVRAVVLTGSGRAFCAGADLRDSSATGPLPPGHVGRMIRRGAQPLISAVLDCEKPVIAAVNGTAAGIGAHLALACDLILAAETADFIEIFVRRGLVPDGGGAHLLTRIVGPARARELLFFGDRLPAREAERLGLINRAVPPGELEPLARAWAGRLAQGPTRTLALTKELVRTALDDDLAASFRAEAVAQELNMTTRDAAEGIAAFAERREPRFEGR
ncbi:enoyl-CoA hydratase/isomerase family protein [Streptomyces sp. NPDC057638]|uniref:enoyl-CoA hydratase/isomerase family protein n=1 Tax=Streptomyces sp. NPDC057638 TaxID=3346190 RepID=UPI0036CFFAD5